MITIKTGVCGSIIEKSIQDTIKCVENTNTDYVDYLELRIDGIKNITSRQTTQLIEKIRDITKTPLILTNRTQKEGGLYSMDDQKRTGILKDNAHLVEITDIELSTDEKLTEQIIKKANKTIISYHNFSKTPDKKYPENIINQASDIGDIPKIATKPHNMQDTQKILELQLKYDNLVAISMDDIGSYTRITGPILGAPITYASIKQQTAPGQLDIKTTNRIIKKLKKEKQ